jgi:hypothetical protein
MSTVSVAVITGVAVLASKRLTEKALNRNKIVRQPMLGLSMDMSNVIISTNVINRYGRSVEDYSVDSMTISDGVISVENVIIFDITRLIRPFDDVHDKIDVLVMDTKRGPDESDLNYTSCMAIDRFTGDHLSIPVDVETLYNIQGRRGAFISMLIPKGNPMNYKFIVRKGTSGDPITTLDGYELEIKEKIHA